jgi:uncharacterized protein
LRRSAPRVKRLIDHCRFRELPMQVWREMLTTEAPLALALGGLLLGALFGALVTRTNFCTMGALADLRALGDGRRLRAWVLAIAVAMLGVQALSALNFLPLDKSMYLTPRLNWLGNLTGGALFGFGMVYAGGCASRNLARVGGGDLRALVTLILMGLFAYMTIGGVIGPARAALEQATSIDLAAMRIVSQSLGDILARLTGQPSGVMSLILGVVGAGLLIHFALSDKAFRTSPANIASGLGIGLIVTAGWALTGLAFDDLSDKPVAPISLTYVRPSGDTLEWLARYTALGLPGFGVTSVFGAVAGAFLMSLAMGRFSIQTFADSTDTLRNMGGAALMGIGGVMALGCTVGQGITGLSTLALGSLLSVVGIVAGSWFALGRLERSL